MDNNNFEQQFAQNIKATTPVQPTYETNFQTTNDSKLPLAIAAVLAVITLMESIALVITLSNYFNEIGGDVYEESSDTPEDGSGYYDAVYSYDSQDNLTAMNLYCTAQDSSIYSLDSNNKYEHHNAAGTTDAAGTYTITNDSLVALSVPAGSESKILYYDGFDLADGLTIYKCEEVISGDTDE